MQLHSTEDRNKNLVYRMFEELWNQGNLAIVEEIFSRNYVGHDPTDPNPETRETHGHQDIRNFVRMMRSAAPDIHFTVEDLIADGDKVIARWTAKGTQRGDLPGVPATGRSAIVSGVTIYRITDDRISEGWQNWDAMGMLQQLGVFTHPFDAE